MRKEEDYTVDEKARSVVLTEEGVAKAEKALGWKTCTTRAASSFCTMSTRR